MSSAAEIQFDAIVAVLPSLDLERTSQFYTRKLGFIETGRYPDYLLLRWGARELHFWLATDPELPKSCACYVRVQGIAALFGQYSAEPGLVHPRGKLEAKPWGITEFVLLDPDGNLLRFGESTPVSSSAS